MDKLTHEPKFSFPFNSGSSTLAELKVDPARIKTEFFRLYPISDELGAAALITIAKHMAEENEVLLTIWLCGFIASSGYEGYGTFEAWDYICGLTGLAGEGGA